MLSPSVNTTSGNFEVYCVTNFKDLSAAPIDLSVIVRVRNFSNFGVAFEKSATIGSVQAVDAQLVFSDSLQSLLSAGHCKNGNKLEDCYITVTLLARGEELYSNSLLPYPKDAGANLRVPKMSAQVAKEVDCPPELDKDAYKGGCYEVSVTTDAVALYVWVGVKGMPGRFSENGFLLDSPSKTIYFYAKEPVPSIEAMAQALTVRSIKNSVVRAADLTPEPIIQTVS